MSETFPDQKIVDFIAQHHVLSLATSVSEQVYMCNCFYVYLPEQNTLLITSDPKTRHGQEMLANSNVAISIVLETKVIGKIQGLQITAEAKMLDGEEAKLAKKAYLKSYPFAILKLETMWALEINFFKLTDNRLGFGKKIIWKKE